MCFLKFSFSEKATKIISFDIISTYFSENLNRDCHIKKSAVIIDLLKRWFHESKISFEKIKGTSKFGEKKSGFVKTKFVKPSNEQIIGVEPKSKKCNVLVCCHNSLLYLTGAFLRFSNSNDGSTANSFPALFLKALVHFALRGFFFFLKFLWHFERQNLNI